jgi:hypothetical protein
VKHTYNSRFAPEERDYFAILKLRVVGTAVIFNPGMVSKPVASVFTSPVAEPNFHWTTDPGVGWNFCNRRTLTSAVAWAGMVNEVFNSAGVTRKRVVSSASARSFSFFQRKNALI